MSIFKIYDYPRTVKRAILLSLDSVLIPLSLYLAFCLRYGTLTPWGFIVPSWLLFPIMTVLGLAILLALRVHNIKLKAFETGEMSRIGAAAIGLAAGAMIVSYLLGLSGPRTVPVIFGVVFSLLAVMARLTALALLRWLTERDGRCQNVAIYGAGAAGIQLAAALRQSTEVRAMFFVDDNINLHGLSVTGLPVFSPEKLGHLVQKYDITQILVAAPSISEKRQAVIVKNLEQLQVSVQVLPSYVEMISGRRLVDSLRPVTPDQLLGRGKVDLDIPEIAKTYAGRVVMVTGAGGSIGSELCRQILDCNPARIVLFERGEFQLYSIDQEMQKEVVLNGIPVISRLGSVVDKARIKQVMAEEGVDIILHAAAYKHVPLVEDNELEGARNNVVGTQMVAEAAYEAQIERFILISTDKAVRPTNIMGATKRMAELVVQDIQTRSSKTRYSIVRFGNVLGSSGSVLPLFQRQIAMGGPVTVTHPDVTRFFMTIPEAARLVLLAGAYANDGDVFVLDMGEPQRIIDIARHMIELSGRKVKDSETGVGDIAVEITGLRPGEKLYEELLIDNESLLATPHEKILRAQENMLSQIEVAAMLRELNTAFQNQDKVHLRGIIQKRVEGYHQQIFDEKIG